MTTLPTILAKLQELEALEEDRRRAKMQLRSELARLQEEVSRTEAEAQRLEKATEEHWAHHVIAQRRMEAHAADEARNAAQLEGLQRCHLQLLRTSGVVSDCHQRALTATAARHAAQSATDMKIHQLVEQAVKLWETARGRQQLTEYLGDVAATLQSLPDALPYSERVWEDIIRLQAAPNAAACEEFPDIPSIVPSTTAASACSAVVGTPASVTAPATPAWIAPYIDRAAITRYLTALTSAALSQGHALRFDAFRLATLGRPVVPLPALGALEELVTSVEQQLEYRLLRDSGRR